MHSIVKEIFITNSGFGCSRTLQSISCFMPGTFLATSRWWKGKWWMWGAVVSAVRRRDHALNFLCASVQVLCGHSSDHLCQRPGDELCPGWAITGKSKYFRSHVAPHLCVHGRVINAKMRYSSWVCSSAQTQWLCLVTALHHREGEVLPR